MRYAIVRNAETADKLARFLPDNYEIIDTIDEDVFVIAGEDNAGWTMDDYVIPRLASGLIWSQEITRKIEWERNVGLTVEYDGLVKIKVTSARETYVRSLTPLTVNGIEVDLIRSIATLPEDPVPYGKVTHLTAHRAGQPAFMGPGITSSQRNKLYDMVVELMSRIPARAVMAGMGEALERKLRDLEGERQRLKKELGRVEAEIRETEFHRDAAATA